MRALKSCGFKNAATRPAAAGLLVWLPVMALILREPTTKIGSHFAPKIGHQRAARLAERKADGP